VIKSGGLIGAGGEEVRTVRPLGGETSKRGTGGHQDSLVERKGLGSLTGEKSAEEMEDVGKGLDGNRDFHGGRPARKLDYLQIGKDNVQIEREINQ